MIPYQFLYNLQFFLTNLIIASKDISNKINHDCIVKLWKQYFPSLLLVHNLFFQRLVQCINHLKDFFGCLAMAILR